MKILLRASTVFRGYKSPVDTDQAPATEIVPGGIRVAALFFPSGHPFSVAIVMHLGQLCMRLSRSTDIFLERSYSVPLMA